MSMSTSKHGCPSLHQAAVGPVQGGHVRVSSTWGLGARPPVGQVEPTPPALRCPDAQDAITLTKCISFYIQVPASAQRIPGAPSVSLHIGSRGQGRMWLGSTLAATPTASHRAIAPCVPCFLRTARNVGFGSTPLARGALLLPRRSSLQCGRFEPCRNKHAGHHGDSQMTACASPVVMRHLSPSSTIALSTPSASLGLAQHVSASNLRSLSFSFVFLFFRENVRGG